MRQIANNTFNDGMLMDMQPLTTPNSVLTDCLNGALITYDGNEFVLQSDDGNAAIDGCKLPKDFIPIGMKEYGGVIYIVSQNPFTGECEIGSFPSPERTIFRTTDIEEAPQTVLRLDNLYSDNKSEGITNTTLNLDFRIDNELAEQILRPGDKFAIYLGEDDFKGIQNFEKLLEIYSGGQLIKRRLFKFKLLRVTSSGYSESVKEIVPRFSTSNGSFYYTKSELLNDSEGSLYAVYNNKLNGYLMLSLELEQVDNFSLDITNIHKDAIDATTFSFDIEASSDVTDQCMNNVIGLEVKVDDLDSELAEADQKYLTTENIEGVFSGSSSVSYGAEHVEIEHTISNKDIDKNISLEIKPYSAFGYLSNLKYSNIINYNILTTAQESTFWKYYLDESLDSEITPDKMRIFYEFIVRGTKNQRNKVDAVYIEFYDIISNASMFYSTDIKDVKTITLDCFVGQNPEMTSTGGLDQSLITSNDYYVLIDKTYKEVYNAALGKIDNDDSSGYTDLDTLSKKLNSNYNIPVAYKVESLFGNTTRYNNLGINLSKENSKLRKNNFYIVAIVGLDFYNNEEELKCHKYVSYNFLWTTGVFNKYWEDDVNFNTLSIPNFVSMESTPTQAAWSEENLLPAALSKTDLEDYSYQSYDEIVIDPSKVSSVPRYDTRILVKGEISKSFQTNIVPNSNILKGYGELKFGQAILSPEEAPIKNISIEEDNNTDLETGSKVDNVTTTISEGTSIPESGIKFNVNINLRSNRSIQCKGGLGDFIKYSNEYKQLYSSADDFKSSCIYQSEFYRLEIHSREGESRLYKANYNLDQFAGVDSDGASGIKGTPISENSIQKNGVVTINTSQQSLFSGRTESFVFSNLAIQNKSSKQGAWGRAETFRNKVCSNAKDIGDRSKYNTQNYIRIVPFIRGTSSYYREANYSSPSYFCLVDNDTIKDLKMSDVVNSFANKFFELAYVQSGGSQEVNMYIPDINTKIQHPSNLSTNFLFKNLSIAKCYVSGFEIITMYKGLKTSLNKEFYQTLNNNISKEDTTNIGLVFNSDKPLVSNFYNENLEEFVLTINEEFTLSGAKFYIIKDGNTMNIPSIVNELTNYSHELNSSTSTDNYLYFKNGNNYLKTSFTVNGKVLTLNFSGNNGIVMGAGRKNILNAYIAPIINDNNTNLLISNCLSSIGASGTKQFLTMNLVYD